jgi:hypothetical protein
MGISSVETNALIVEEIYYQTSPSAVQRRLLDLCLEGLIPNSLCDRVLTGMVLKGLPMEALSLYLGPSIAILPLSITRLGLPVPSGEPMRKPRGRNPWTVDEVQFLIGCWVRNFHAQNIADVIGRSAGAIRSKARRLGLYRRDRREVIRQRETEAGHVPQTVPPHSVDEPPTGPVIGPVERSMEGSAASAEVVADVPKSAPIRIQWNDDLDLEVARRWFAWQCRFGIARDLGISAAAIRTRATRMGLPPRDRRKIVPDYVPDQTYDRSLEESRVRRRCHEGKMFFFGTRNGPHTSPKIMQTKKYKESRSGMTEVTLHWN